MKRDIYRELLAWKNSARRKPLLLKGARQTGKTYILQQFGKNEYDNVHYFNFESDPILTSFFQRDLKPDRILNDLAIYSRSRIHPEKDLIIFDEIQQSNNALNSLKYFFENAGEYHIGAAGSLLGVKLSQPLSFPVGKVNFLTLHPMTFLEFLTGTGEDRYRELLENLETPSPLAIGFHQELIDLLKRYYVIGGMPEVVNYYAESGDLLGVRSIQQEILNSYALDYAKYATGSDIPKLSQVWESIPTQLARENKKFVFSAMKKSARGREYENAITWLEDAGLILRAFNISTAKKPLQGYVDRNSFKIYMLDIGLLGAMTNMSIELFAQGDKLFTEYKGAFVENYVAQQLAAMKRSLYYWSRSSGTAELDFILETTDSILPLEVKAGINPKSKSLLSYDDRFHPPLLLRSTLLNLKRDGKIINIPLYALNYLEQFPI